jgi:uridine kinase
MEHFYKPKTAEQRDMALRGNYNLDHPSAFDEKLLFKTLEDLLNGKTVKVKIMNKTTNFLIEIL